MNLKDSLDKIHFRYYSNVKMIKEFLEKTDGLLIRRQSDILKRRSNFSDKDIKEFEDFMKSLKSFREDEEKIKAKVLPLKPTKVGKFIWGLSIPIKQRIFLSEMSLVYLISYQEAFIQEYFKEILISQRELLKSEKTLTFKEICDFNSIDSLIEHMAQKEVDKNLDDGIDEFEKYIDKRFGLPVEKEFLEWKTVREASYRRNIIVHNRGRTNEKYCSKTGHRKTNEHLKTDSAYVQNATNAVLSFIDFIHSKMCKKFG